MKKFLAIILIILMSAGVAFCVVSSSTSRIAYNANGATVAFPFTFGVGATEEIEVVLTTPAGVETVLTETTHYTVGCTNNDCESGGTVTTVATYATGNTITVLRNVPLTQEDDFTENMPTLYETFEDALDKGIRIDQQQQEQINRTLKLSKSSAYATNTYTLPDPESGKVIGWNTGGTDLTTFSTDSGLSIDIAPPLELISDHGNNIATAVTAIGASEKTLLIDGATAGDTTVPSNINLWFIRGGSLTGVVEINSPEHIIAPPTQQIFPITATITFTYGGIVYPEWWGENTTPGTTDMTQEIQAATDSLEATAKGGVIDLANTTYRLDGQWTINGNSITVRGKNLGIYSQGWGTTLDLRYAAGIKIVLGGAAGTYNYRFEHMHIDANNGGFTYVFETRTVRGLVIREVTLYGVYGFLQLGRSGEATSVVTLDAVTGAMKSPAHSHFVTLINFAGALFLTGAGGVEGSNPISANSYFIYGAAGISAPALDTVVIEWGCGRFDKALFFEAGIANLYVAPTAIFDTLGAIGFEFNSGENPVANITIMGAHIVGSNKANSNGIVFFQSTNITRDITVIGARLREWSRQGIWTNGVVTNAKFIGNNVADVGTETDNTYDGFHLGDGFQGVAIGNVIDTTAEANKARYGIWNDSTDADIIIQGNIVEGYQTAAVYNPDRASAATRSVRGNTGDFVKGKYLVGPWHLLNAAANQTDTAMTALGQTTYALTFRPIRRCRITGITVTGNAAITVSTITFKAALSGAATALTVTLTAGGSDTENSATSAAGIEVDAGEDIGVLYSSSATYAGATQDFTVFLEVIED